LPERNKKKIAQGDSMCVLGHGCVPFEIKILSGVVNRKTC